MRSSSPSGVIAPSAAEDQGFDWQAAFQHFLAVGFERVVITGGGTLVASLLAADVIDELWLTVCPLLLGGDRSPTPMEGDGFVATLAPRLELLSVKAIAHEVFLHYRVQRSS